MMTPDDEPIRTLFAELKRSDADAAPPFQRDWQAAMQLNQRQGRQQPLIRWAAAAAVLAVAVTIGLLQHRPDAERTAQRPTTLPPTDPATTTTLPQPKEQVASESMEDWESPTAALLDLSSDGWSGGSLSDDKGREDF